MGVFSNMSTEREMDTLLLSIPNTPMGLQIVKTLIKHLIAEILANDGTQLRLLQHLLQQLLVKQNEMIASLKSHNSK
ncbi:hypothetical protein pipiens_010743 [Culex pipiens pipiens]|uniref:Uncharacterized protein n=1 Tax=Culex pipiens pipiens TaxID=38569 RepID=A0ABD1D910_CULPP